MNKRYESFIMLCHFLMIYITYLAFQTVQFSSQRLLFFLYFVKVSILHSNSNSEGIFILISFTTRMITIKITRLVFMCPFMFIVSTCPFKCSSSLKWIFIYFGKKNSKVVITILFLCLYHFSCGVDFSIEFEWFLKLYSYMYHCSHLPWCESAVIQLNYNIIIIFIPKK